MSLRIACDLDGVLADMDSALRQAAERLFGPARPQDPTPALPGDDPSSTLAQAAARSAALPGAATAGAASLEAAGRDLGTPADDPDEAGETAIEEETQSPRLRTLTAWQQNRLWRSVGDTDNFWETLNECEPGAIARLNILARERRWEVIFITQRPPSGGDPTQLQSQRWLARHGFTYPSVYVIRGSRGRIASALGLDIVIDDRPDNCVDVLVDSKARPILIWRDDEQAAMAANARRLGITVTGSVLECFESLARESEPSKARNFLKRLKPW